MEWINEKGNDYSLILILKFRSYMFGCNIYKISRNTLFFDFPFVGWKRELIIIIALDGKNKGRGILVE